MYSALSCYIQWPSVQVLCSFRLWDLLHFHIMFVFIGSSFYVIFLPYICTSFCICRGCSS
jgi:hypothetical protein